jgi:2-polyprenyl-6-hydroxyphenyl methylase/3-demethylubiquinone-9 3-methyltransferase
VTQRSVFELSPAEGRFDVVHSWGVLHHTGALWRAMETAAAMVAPGGTFAVALYRRTPLCGFWKREKRLYAAAPPPVQAVVRGLYKVAYAAGLAATGRNPIRYVREYAKERGMSWHHDVHDWLGGYPYESTTPEEVMEFLKKRGFRIERTFEHEAAARGLFGSHCDEFVARKKG